MHWGVGIGVGARYSLGIARAVNSVIPVPNLGAGACAYRHATKLHISIESLSAMQNVAE